jgi:hypothetical protein
MNDKIEKERYIKDTHLFPEDHYSFSFYGIESEAIKHPEYLYWYAIIHIPENHPHIALNAVERTTTYNIYTKDIGEASSIRFDANTIQDWNPSRQFNYYHAKYKSITWIKNEIMRISELLRKNSIKTLKAMALDAYIKELTLYLYNRAGIEPTEIIEIIKNLNNKRN